MNKSVQHHKRLDTRELGRYNALSAARDKLMNVDRRGPARPKRVYAKGAIPYAVSAPNRFWRLKKGLPNDVYWKKRYWRRRITGRGMSEAR